MKNNIKEVISDVIKIQSNKTKTYYSDLMKLFMSYDNIDKKNILIEYLELTEHNKSEELNNIISSMKTILKNRKTEPLNEVSMNLKPSFKISLDDNGDFIIEKQENVNFMDVYMASHKLLMLYEKSKNIDGIKYELSKLWYLLMIIESKVIYTNRLKKSILSKEKINEANKARAFILNDFKKYMKLILSEEKDFNFDVYFINTKFGSNIYKINQKSVRSIINILKFI